MSDQQEEQPQPAKRRRAARKDWGPIIDAAAEIMAQYETGVTLRQLFYRLVSAEIIPNSKSAYQRLSRVTAQARRDGTFPDLIDNTRGIAKLPSWSSAESAMDALIDQFRFDRTEGQVYSLYVGVEKNALRSQLSHWFQERGIPVIALSGYTSQTFVQDIIDDIERRDRPAILIYGGDFDASGVDILRDFEERTKGWWEEVVKVALNEGQIAEYNLPPLPGKYWDARAASFEQRYGRLVQVELDALPPDVLRGLYEGAVANYWDGDVYDEVIERERADALKLLHVEDVQQVFDDLVSAHDALDVAARLRARPSRVKVGLFKDARDNVRVTIAEHGEGFDAF